MEIVRMPSKIRYGPLNSPNALASTSHARIRTSACQANCRSTSPLPSGTASDSIDFQRGKSILGETRAMRRLTICQLKNQKIKQDAMYEITTPLSAAEQVWDVIGMPGHLARKDIGKAEIG